jgi:hypothetical protein
MTKVTQFEVVHFREQIRQEGNKKPIEREIILMYALGEDGIMYEMAAGKWLALPIVEENMRKVQPLENQLPNPNRN